MTHAAPLRIAIIAGEASGDLLGADLVAALRRQYPGPLELVGVGGSALEEQGLASLFDYSDLSIMGLTAVIGRLPLLLRRLRETTQAIIAARPDVLILVDSPDFTHRVAKRVRKALPSLPVVDYVCPSVWAWKEYRARDMLAYVDHVLAVLPFEPAVMERLGGPTTTYIGHRLATAPALLAARDQRLARPEKAQKTLLLLPGSRGSEIARLMPVLRGVTEELAARGQTMRYMMPTVASQLERVRSLVADWPVKPEIGTGEAFKWSAFAAADAAIAASGTVLLELALTGIPVVSAYKTDFLITLLSRRIKTWTGALPNLIADYPVVPEYINEVVRSASLARWAERLMADTTQRRAMLEGFDLVRSRMQTAAPAGEAGAAIVLDLLQKRG